MALYSSAAMGLHSPEDPIPSADLLVLPAVAIPTDQHPRRRSTRVPVPSKLSIQVHDSPSPPPPPRPSLKALGKRPERPPTTPAHSLDSDAPKSKGKGGKKKVKQVDGVDESKRRVMPVRTRRGGPGVGSSAVDAMIMESQQRSAENKYIIPPDTVFLITSDANLVPPLSNPASENEHQSYFDQPEVIKSYREQQIIQTPEFSRLQEASLVGSRLRTRPATEDVADTSDALFIRRHRKYETFEKRQRFREKEKLQYEHFKLRERIDELKIMDASAFANEGGVDAEESKRMMLKEAEELDRRYTILLPDRRAVAAKKGAGTGVDLGDERGSSLASDGVTNGTGSSIRLRLKRGRNLFAAPLPRDSEEVEYPGEDPVEEGEDGVIGVKDEGDQGVMELDDDDNQEDQQMDFERDDDDQQTSHRTRNYRHAQRRGRTSQSHSTSTRSPPRKRIRLVENSSPSKTIISDPHSATSGTSAPGQSVVPILMQTALASKALAQPNAKRRQAPRHPLAFGVKMPDFIDTEIDFDLPRWIVRDVEVMKGDEVGVDPEPEPGQNS